MSNKTFCTLTYFFLISSLSFSQINNPLSTQNYFNLLVPSQNVPYDFILSVPDSAVQILFNPARAANSTTRFVCGTYNTNIIRRSPSNTPDIILTTLLKKSNTKWLLTFANRVRNSEDTSYNKEYFSPIVDSYTNKDYERNSKTENSTTCLKFSMIRNTHFGGYSLGIFGIYNRLKGHGSGDQNEISDTFYESYQGVDSINQYIRHRNYAVAEKGASDGSAYILGMEYSLSGCEWDFITTISYQKSDNYKRGYWFSSDTRMDSSIHITPDTTIYSITNTDANQTNDYNVSNKPAYLVLNTYWRNKLSLITPHDHLFASLNAIYLFDGIKYNYRENKEYFMSVDSHLSGDTLNSYSTGKQKGKFWQVRFSTGYILQKQLHGLYFFTGINPIVTYGESRNISNPKAIYPRYYSYSYGYIGYYPSPILRPTRRPLPKPGRSSRYYYPFYSKTDLLINNKKTLYLSINLPLYFNFSPLKWLNIFGGFNYSYSYQYDKIESKNPEITISTGPGSNSDNSYSNNSQNKSTKLQSYRMSYMGISIKHHSGIVVDFAFNGDLARLSIWNISVGYNF